MTLNLYRYKYYSVFFSINNYMTKDKTFKYFKTKKYRTYSYSTYNNNVNNKKRLNLLALYKYYYKDNKIKQHKKGYNKIIKTII